MKDDRVYLQHIRDALGRILSYTASGRDAFLANPQAQDAVIRNLEIIGEAVKHLPPSCASSIPTSPGSASPACAMR